MTDLTYHKKCEGWQLTVELKEAGYAVHGVSTEERPDGSWTTVHLKEGETRLAEVEAIVAAHTPVKAGLKGVGVLQQLLAEVPWESEKLRLLCDLVGLNYDSVIEPAVAADARDVLAEMVRSHKAYVERLKVLRRQAPVKRLIKAL